MLTGCLPHLVHRALPKTLRSVTSPLSRLGALEKQQTGWWLNNCVENPHLPFRRRERAMQRFRRMRSLQKFATVHSSVYNQFDRERSLTETPSSRHAPPPSPSGVSFGPDRFAVSTAH
ncbi:DDE-type integrase/transposase/recombinase [Ruegeria sp. HKCCA6948]|uniref:DDE-type integrase/transposase/recombinase n=1 Tax=unclassified Ruegeria TaxID=2625375 RepID=UPI0035300761